MAFFITSPRFSAYFRAGFYNAEKINKYIICLPAAPYRHSTGSMAIARGGADVP